MQISYFRVGEIGIYDLINNVLVLFTVLQTQVSDPGP